MTAKLLPLALLALAMSGPVRNDAPRPAPRSDSQQSSSKVDFQSRILPILQARCQPCHFEGGKMYTALPFDRPETIHKLGEKVFTRIKDPKEQELLREFMAERR
jgi:hypothetical protein